MVVAVSVAVAPAQAARDVETKTSRNLNAHGTPFGIAQHDNDHPRAHEMQQPREGHSTPSGTPQRARGYDEDAVKQLIAKLQGKIRELRALAPDGCSEGPGDTPPHGDVQVVNGGCDPSACEARPCEPQPCDPSACEARPCEPQPCDPSACEAHCLRETRPCDPAACELHSQAVANHETNATGLSPCEPQPCVAQPCEPQPCASPMEPSSDGTTTAPLGWFAWLWSCLFWWANWCVAPRKQTFGWFKKFLLHLRISWPWPRGLCLCLLHFLNIVI